MDPLDIQAEKLLKEQRESKLILNREGRWFHDGDPVEHERLAAALHTWIDRDAETGRYILRVGEQWCFIEVEDAPFVVTSITTTKDGEEREISLRLTDGTKEKLAYDTLRQRPDNVLYCDVKGGKFKARFSRNAYFNLAELVELHDDEPRLPAAGRLWSISMVEDQ